MSSWAESWARSSPRNRIVLATASTDLERRLQQATDGACLSLPLGPLPPNPAALFGHLGEAPRPELVVLDAGPDPAPALALATLFDVQCPGITVIVVSPAAQDIGTDAMQAGVRAILDPEADEATIRSVLDRAYENTRTRARDQDLLAAATGPAQPGRVITVTSAKGGVGRTMVATNLAVGLARTRPGSTVLVDLDLQFGDVACALGLDPEYCLTDAVRGLATRDTMVLKTFLTLHATGLYVICGPKTPGEGDTVAPESVSRLLEMLRSEFSYVVVDTGVGLSEHVLAALDESSDVVLVSGMDVPGVRDLRKEVDALSRLGLVTEGRHVVLNCVDERAGLSVSDVEATLGAPADIRLPRSLAVQASINEGVPLLQRPARREPVTKQLQRLQTRLVPDAPVPPGVPAPVNAPAVRARRAASLPALTWGRGRRAASQ